MAADDEPSNKKQRTDSSTSLRPPQPDISTSSSNAASVASVPITTRIASANSTTRSTSQPEETVRGILRQLRNSSTFDSAFQAIQDLYAQLMPDKAKRVDLIVATSITQLNGGGAILMALKDWYADSNDFCRRAIRCLVLVTANVPVAKQYVVELGGVRTIIQAAEKYPTDYFLQSNSVGLIHNLAMGVANTIRKELASEECLEFVCQNLKEWPDDRYTQKRGIKYLLTIGRMNDAQATITLQKKKVGVLFVNALDRFRNTNPEVKELAEEALQWYATS